jgi:hypothetical protein
MEKDQGWLRRRYLASCRNDRTLGEDNNLPPPADRGVSISPIVCVRGPNADISFGNDQWRRSSTTTYRALAAHYSPKNGCLTRQFSTWEMRALLAVSIAYVSDVLQDMLLHVGPSMAREPRKRDQEQQELRLRYNASTTATSKPPPLCRARKLYAYGDIVLLYLRTSCV